MKVRDIMERDIVTVGPNESVLDLIRLLSDEEIGGVPVVDSARSLQGVVSATDVLRAAADEEGPRYAPGDAGPDWRTAAEGAGGEEEEGYYDYFHSGLPPGSERSLGEALQEHALEGLTVREIMTPAPFTVDPETSLPELARLLLDRRIHRAVVVEDGRMAGIVTPFDILRVVASEEWKTPETSGKA